MFDDQVTDDGRRTVRRNRPTDGADPGETHPLDRSFDALADGRRRALLRHLSETDGDAASFAELVDHVAGRGTAPDVDRVAASVFHVHLPKLAEADLVEYDDRNRTVRYRGDELVEAWLERVERVEREADG